MSPVKAPRIPDSAEIRFVVYTPTGTVHIHEHCPAPYVRAPVSEMSFAEGLMAMWTTHQRMLCGEHFLVGFPGARGDWEDCFEDDDFCARCIRALGDQSPRAFEHRRPSDPEDEL
jgi:hypothetical protein